MKKVMLLFLVFAILFAQYVNDFAATQLTVRQQLVNKTNALTQKSKTDSQKIIVIFKWITKVIQYDFEKANQEKVKDYTMYKAGDAGAEYAFRTKKGTCYDMAVLFKEMCKVKKIPVKIVYGWTQVDDWVFFGNPLQMKIVKSWRWHNWNKVLYKGKWILVDCTSQFFNDKNINTKKMYAEYLALDNEYIPNIE